MCQLIRQEYSRKVREAAFLVEEIETLKKELRNVRGYTLPRKLMKAKSTTTEIEQNTIEDVDDMTMADDIESMDR